jgi:MFS family permease
MKFRNLGIILFITFLDFLSVSVFFGTSIPLVLDKHSVFALGLGDHQRATVYGLTLLILPLGQFLLTPIWGQLSDQFGRKPILFCTVLGSAIGYFLMGIGVMSQLFVIFILGRMITATVAANLALGQASVADSNQGQGKTQRFNLQYIFVSLGFVVGPYLISFTTHAVNYANVYWVIASGYVLAFLMVVLLFRETLPYPTDSKIYWSLNFRRIGAIFHNSRMKKVLILWMVFQLGWSLFFQYSGEFLFLKHHATNEFINHLFSWVGLGIVAVEICLVPLVASKVPPEKVVPVAIALIGVGLLVMGFLPLNVGFYCLMGLYCLGIGFFLTNMSAYVSNLAGDHGQGRAMSMMSASQACMDIAVTFAGSFFVSYYLPTPYVIGGLVILGSLWLWPARERTKK